VRVTSDHNAPQPGTWFDPIPFNHPPTRHLLRHGSVQHGLSTATRIAAASELGGGADKRYLFGIPPIEALMETSKIVISMLVVCGIVISAIFVLPVLITKLTKPGWAIAKSFAEFLALGLLFSAFLPAAWALGSASVLAIFRHQARVTRHKELLLAESEEGKNQQSQSSNISP
jgi:hypothetical protein